MAKRGIKGITTIIAVVLAIVTLIVGLVVGMVVEGSTRALFPVPEIEELEDRIDELEATVADLNDTIEALLPMLLAEAQFIEDSLDVTFDLTGLTGEVKLGGPFALTGDLATFGENEKVAAEFAVKQVNVLLEALGATWTLSLLVEDTQTEDDICLEKIESFGAKGIKLVVGPLSSGELRAIKGYIDANRIMCISQSSTAPDLAIADDYIFRFCPTDLTGQGPACGRFFYDEGIRYIIPFTRNDPWGVGLEEAGDDRFEELGGTVLEGIRYHKDTVEFSAEASDLKTKVDTALADPAINETNLAVWDISFEEIVGIMTAAAAYPVLSTIKWYGSDGTAGSAAIIEDPDVLDFAMSVEFPNTIFAPTHSWKWQMVREHGLEVLGREPESYSYAVYDIVWAYAYSLLVTGEYDADAVREVLPDVVAVWFGSTGVIELNENGDRTEGDYDIWQIVETDGTYEWDIIATYVLATDSVVYK